jgi:hypothetical protein
MLCPLCGGLKEDYTINGIEQKAQRFSADQADCTRISHRAQERVEEGELAAILDAKDGKDRGLGWGRAIDALPGALDTEQPTTRSERSPVRGRLCIKAVLV